MSRLNRMGLAMTLAAVSAVAIVQAATPAGSEAEAKKAIEARQKIFEQLKDQYEPIGNMLKRKTPTDGAVVAANAAKIEQLANQIPAAFKVDTRSFKGIKTRALDGIWNSEADFKSKADAMAKAAADAVTAGKSGDAKAIQTAMIAMGKGCGGCHDSYRSSDE